LSLGLPADNPMTAAELNTRVNDCLGVRKPVAQRSPEQIQKIKTIVDVLKIPENSIAGHLNWGTFTLRDVVTKSGGASPFGNDTVKYRGSSNDAALNAAVLRFKADPQASARFDADVNHRGRFKVPVLSAHGIRDSTVFVEGSDTLRLRMASAGNGARLVQTYVDSAEHSYWGDAMYPPLFEALLAWVNQGTKPTPVGIAARCAALRPAQASECRFQTAYTPQPLATRIAPR
jgi:hypothetical protein